MVATRSRPHDCVCERLAVRGELVRCRRRGAIPRSAGIIGAGRSWTAAMISVLSIPRRYREVIARSACPSCRWITSSGMPSRTFAPRACASRRARRRRTPAASAAWWSRACIRADAHGRPRVGPRTTQNSLPTGRAARSSLSHGSRCAHAQRSIRPRAAYRPSRVMPSVCLYRRRSGVRLTARAAGRWRFRQVDEVQPPACPKSFLPNDPEAQARRQR